MGKMERANDNDPNVQIEIRAARRAIDDDSWIRGESEFDSGFDWDPSRPLAEQWPWNGEAKVTLGDPDARIIEAISELGAQHGPPELTVEQLADDLCDGCDEPKTECRRTYAGCLYRPDSDDVHGPCCDLNCPDMATHFSRTGSIP